MQTHILSIILFTPLVGALFLLFVPKENKAAIRWIANFFALAGLVVSLPLIPMFWEQRFEPGFKFIEGAPGNWIPSIGAGYVLGIDGISFLLIMLTTLLGWISILSSWTAIENRVKEYYIWFLFLQTGMLGVFMALDFFLFFVFWEAMLVPMYLLIGIWGGPRKLYAAIKFFLYTLAGSVLMLLGILFLYFHHHSVTNPQVYTFSIVELYKTAPQIYTDYGPHVATLLFLSFFFAFAIKVPMFPFHTWLPDAHVEAPTAGSVILAGVLLKMGTYGLLRLSTSYGADVPVPHLAARRARGSADRRLRDSGGRPAEDGNVRPDPFLAAILPGGRHDAVGAPVRDCAFADRHHLRRAGFADAEGHEEAGGVLVGQPPRLLHPRHNPHQPE